MKRIGRQPAARQRQTTLQPLRCSRFAILGFASCSSVSEPLADLGAYRSSGIVRCLSKLLRSSARRAFTLLEVVLALALSVLVIGAISWAVYFHLRVLEDQRNRVEQALVVRGLLQMMATDIRAGVQYKPIDMTELETLLAGSDLTALLAASGTGMSADDLGMGTGGTDSTADDSSDDEEEPPRPGLFGSAEMLQVDISRMPRRDEYLFGVSQDGQDFSSDLKSVVYMLVPTSSIDPSMMIGLAPVSNENMSTSFSLVRTSISQSVARLAMQNGVDVSSLGQMQVLANEVQSLSFNYFDGSAGQWTSSWDSEANESLPTAVEIVMSVRMSGSSVNPQDFPTDSYRLVVHLPLAEPPDDSSGDSSGTSDDSSDTDDDTGSLWPIDRLRRYELDLIERGQA